MAVALDLAWAAARSRMQYRGNFILLVIFAIVFQTTGFIFIWVVLARFEALGGWTLGQVAFLYGLRLVAHGVNCVFLGGTARVRWLVRQGEFDRYLIRPMSPLMQVLTIGHDPKGIGDLLGGLAIFAAAAGVAGIDWSPLAVAYLSLAVFGGAFLEAALMLVIAALSFRLTETGNLNFFVDNLFSSFGNYPLKIFSTLSRALFTFAIPIAFVAYFPATVLLARTDELSVQPWVAYAAPLLGLVLYAIAVQFWRLEILQYKSAGH